VGTECGELNADIDYIQNVEFHLIKLEGHIYGEQTLSNVEVEGLPDISGGFEGRFTAQFIDEGDGWVVHYVADGIEGFDNMKLFQTCTGGYNYLGQPSETCEGFILDPHGTIPDEPCP
jgi:hypothetical protein